MQWNAEKTHQAEMPCVHSKPCHSPCYHKDTELAFYPQKLKMQRAFLQWPKQSTGMANEEGWMVMITHYISVEWRVDT